MTKPNLNEASARRAWRAYAAAALTGLLSNPEPLLTIESDKQESNVNVDARIKLGANAADLMLREEQKRR